MLLLIGAYLTADTHSLSQQIHQLVIDTVKLRAQRAKAFGGAMLVADDKQRQYKVEHIRCHLLPRIAPSLVGLTVTFHDESVEAKVHGLLAEWRYKLSTPSYMAGIADDGQVGNTAMQLYGKLPHGEVAVDFLVSRRESPVDSSHTLYSRLIDTLHSAYPKFQVRTHRILYEHGNVNASQTVGKVLHGERIGARTRTYPQDINAILQTELHMLWLSHFRSHKHTRLFFHLLEPGQSLLTLSLKTSGLRTWLPNAGTEVMASLGGKLTRCGEYLLLGLGTARTGYHERPLVVAR